MKHTLSSAASATGKSKSTIYRAVKNGKISAFRNENGDFEIDPSELHRVFPPVSHESEITQQMTQTEMAMIRQENGFLRQQLAREREFVEILEKRLENVTALLTHQTEKKSDGSELWKKVFKR
jgi:DNA-directed RNA polymerase specialized sigma54-like protein